MLNRWIRKMALLSCILGPLAKAPTFQNRFLSDMDCPLMVTDIN